MLAREGREVAARASQIIDGGATSIVRVGARDERRARETIARFAVEDVSSTDATSFAVMERFRIGHAFTVDRHFARYGVAALGSTDRR